MAGQVSFWKQVVVAAVLVGGAGFAWTERTAISQAFGIAEDTGSGARARASRIVPVLVAPVGQAVDDLVVEVVGTGRAQRSVMLRPKTSGRIVDLALEPGRTYAEGDVLMQLDAAEERLAVELAETRLAEAERVRDRILRLEATGATTGNRVDEVRTAARIAAIELEQARQALADRTLIAPFAGHAGLTDLDVGAWVDQDTEVVSLDDRSVIEVELDLPEALLARLDPGAAVTATTAAAPGRVLNGTVSAIDSRVAVESRTFRVRVALPNGDDSLRPGASFSVSLSLPGPSYPVVPELSIQFSRGALFVWRIRDGAAEKVEVRLIRRRDGNVLVDAPLTQGEAVVVEGTQRLIPGRQVEVLDRAGPGA